MISQQMLHLILVGLVASLGVIATPTPRDDPTAIPSPWQAVTPSCIAEGTSGRALPGASFSADDMTYSKCINFCAGRGYGISALEFSRECWCSDALVNGASTNRPSSNCNMACSGSPSQICGGPDALTVFILPEQAKDLAPDLTVKAENLKDNGWALASTPCIAEGTEGRALVGVSTSSSTMSGYECTRYCQARGFAIAGTEYSRECFCGNALVNGASLDRPSNNCNMACAGNKNSICGGPGALTLYTNPNVRADLTQSSSGMRLLGCIEEVPGRILTGFKFDFPDMSVDKCTDACTDRGFRYAGVEHQSECFCGNELSNGADLSATSDKCYMACPGAPLSKCGGPDALQLYVR